MKKTERNKLMLSCHKEGKSQEEIGNIFNLSQSAVSKILIDMKNGKYEDFTETRGRKSKLTDVEKGELSLILATSPLSHGFTSWNKHSIQSIIKEKFSVTYHKNYIYKIMGCINFTSQKPKLKDYRKNEKLVSDFTSSKALEIKKNG